MVNLGMAELCFSPFNNHASRLDFARIYQFFCRHSFFLEERNEPQQKMWQGFSPHSTFSVYQTTFVLKCNCYIRSEPCNDVNTYLLPLRFNFRVELDKK